MTQGKELSPLQHKVLDMIQASREAADARAHQIAAQSFMQDERLAQKATYAELANQEASSLGKRMLFIDRLRMVPFVGTTDSKLSRSDAGLATIVRGHLVLPKVNVSTPLLFTTELDHYDEVAVTTGWRATAHTQGSDLRAFGYAMIPADDGNSRERKLTGLTLAQVVQSPGDEVCPATEEVVQSATYDFWTGKLSEIPEPMEERDAEDPFYFNQLSMLRAIRAQIDS